VGLAPALALQWVPERERVLAVVEQERVPEPVPEQTAESRLAQTRTASVAAAPAVAADILVCYFCDIHSDRPPPPHHHRRRHHHRHHHHYNDTNSSSCCCSSTSSLTSSTLFSQVSILGRLPAVFVEVESEPEQEQVLELEQELERELELEGADLCVHRLVVQ